MFSSRFWLGVIVGIIVMFVLMFLLNVDADSIRAVVKDTFGGSKAPGQSALEHARLAALFVLGVA
jgi:hypothetical protein